jgi:hypothetical protein
MGVAGLGRGRGSGLDGDRYGAGALARGGTQNTVVADEMEARGRHERRELLDQLLGGEDDSGRAVAPGVLEAVEQTPISELCETRARQRGTGHVAAQALESLAVARGYSDVGVQAESGGARAARAREDGEVFDIDEISHAQYPATGAPTCCDPS